MRISTIAIALLGVVLCAGPAWAVDTIYLDLDAIDTTFWDPPLTQAQKNQLKDLIVADVQRNYDSALGPGKVTVTRTAGGQPSRTGRLRDSWCWGTKPDGTSVLLYGKWESGSAEARAYLRMFSRTHRGDYKTDGQWDLAKLASGIGRTLAHEIAHSYSIGHNQNTGDKHRLPQSKMTEGGLVSSADRANQTWNFDQHSAEVIAANLGRAACQTATDYDEDYVAPVFFNAPDFPNPDYDPNLPGDPTDPNNPNTELNPLDEWDCFDATLVISGPLAESFDLGWYGRDTDGGLEDGNPEFDFIYKASAAELEPPGSLTFFAVHHASAQFVLRGRELTPWEGLWFPMSDAVVLPSDFVVTPAGDEVFRHLDIQWDIEGDGLPDVNVALDSFMLYPFGEEFNGWQIRSTWPWLGDFDYDFDVDLGDLAQLLAHYGQPWGAGFEDGDMNGDRDVDLSDLAALLARYGTKYPGWVRWADNFDSYLPGSQLHGQGGWKGWDNDPAFGASVTDVEALSLPNSANISENSDLVHEFSGVHEQAWAFTTWQYIPSDFQSGDEGQFAGSYFILMNTYVDGGPHENSDWSIQMQFDSNDGMLKVYYGDGLNTVNTPYDTDRWVKIEAIVDLDADWTSIYYDDMLVAEYSWTGGIFGEGGGAAEIASVDLDANGSTPVFYDDLKLMRAEP